uniref:Uncharacterized protein n=1 Tax=Wuchereria bancrofti TaxID=6293 RepID=A0A1I8F0N7_WUCBA
MQIEDKLEISIGNLICKDERSTIYKATRYFTKKGFIKTITEQPIVLEEMDDCTAAIIDDLFRELHIVCTIRHQIGH